MSLAFLSVMMVFLAACGSGNKSSSESASATVSPNASEAVVEQSDAPKVTLKLYGQQNSQELKEVYNMATEAMKKKMPNVEIEFDAQPANDDGTKLKTYAASGQLPDIFVATSADIEVLKKSNNILTLDSYIKDLKVEDQLNDTGKLLVWDKDGHSYSMPNEGPWLATFYINKKVFADAGVAIPTNFDEFLEAVKTFKSKDIIPLALFGSQPWPGQQLFDALVVKSGESRGLLKVNDGEADFSPQAYQMAAAKMFQLVNAGLLSKDAFSTDYNMAESLLQNGKAAMMLSGGFTMSDFAKTMPGNYDIIWLPLEDKAQTGLYKDNASGGGFNQGFSVSANSKYKDIAAQYAVQYALEYSRAKTYLNGAPNGILKDTPQPQNPWDEVQQKYVAEFGEFKTVTSFPWGLTDAKFSIAYGNNTQKMLAKGYKSSDDYIAEMNKAIADIRK
ncbi:ABC transporter substrate-binding protein [Paenibacillus psychroresistens]|uniref:ABC transporter substrate-binding protein n=1 Tax=Paenibacillus psychroresistens TaxID=1778678 RepID=UPI0013910353|nr:extracellular solute-binding protein [Paenibacillus psychroresistens]